MMDYINFLIDSYNFPLLTAFLLGILSSLSPCPLATNLTAIAYISREVQTARNTLLNGLAYTLGRGLSYTLLVALLYLGFSSFEISKLFQGWGDKVLGPVLILISLALFGLIKMGSGAESSSLKKMEARLAQKGYLGAFLLGMLFALAFCPYSGVIFFGILVPLVLKSEIGILFAPVFALGTGLPVIILAMLLATSCQKLGQAFRMMQTIEKVLRFGVASTFLLVGIYYTQFLISYLINL